MSSTKYLSNIETIMRKDNTICVVKNGKTISLPVNRIRELFFLTDVKLSSGLLSFLGANGVVVHFYDYYQNYKGTFYPKDRMMAGKILLKQVEAYQKQRSFIAKKFVSAIAVNIDYLLMHYYKHGNKHVKPCLDWIRKDFPNLLEQAETISQIMCVEGFLWDYFYSEFNHILNTDFSFDKRTRQPPTNPLNAMISYGNSILYAKCITILYETNLEQGVSFLHELKDGRFSLSLDMSEMFKVVIVFRTIFDLVNRRKIQVDKHFEQSLNCCLLNQTGRDIFITELEKRLSETFYHNGLKRKISYRYAIKLYCYKLMKYISEGRDFEFFSLKDMR